jgi:hypothetical protein
MENRICQHIDRYLAKSNVAPLFDSRTEFERPFTPPEPAAIPEPTAASSFIDLSKITPFQRAYSDEDVVRELGSMAQKRLQAGDKEDHDIICNYLQARKMVLCYTGYYARATRDEVTVTDKVDHDHTKAKSRAIFFHIGKELDVSAVAF